MAEKASEFREEVKTVIKRHDVSANELRGLASDLEHVAEKWDELEGLL